jgi:hypothetical protein
MLEQSKYKAPNTSKGEGEEKKLTKIYLLFEVSYTRISFTSIDVVERVTVKSSHQQ